MCRRIVILLCLLSLIISCGDVDSGEVSSKITWSSGGSRSLSINSSDSTSAAKSIGDSVVTEYYSDYGDLIGTITPTKFKIPLQAVELSNADGYVTPIPFHKFDDENQVWIMQYADFASNVTTEPGVILKEEYTDFLLFFFSGTGNMGMGSTPGVDAIYSNEVVLDLPDEYAGEYPIEDSISQAWNGTGFEDLILGSEPIYETKVIDADGAVYQVCLNLLFPGPMEDGTLQREWMEIFWFKGNEYIIYDVPDGQESHDLFDYKTTPGMATSGGAYFTRLPWDGVTISQETESIEFELSWDLTDIVEIYDNNTPSDLADDILVLIDKFWERIHINVTQYDSAGILIE